MKKNSERMFMNVAIRNGCVGILAVVLAVMAQGAQAAPGDVSAMGTSLEGPVQPTCVARNDGDESGDVESTMSANALTIPVRPAWIVCCLPPSPGVRLGLCQKKIFAEDCINAGGHPESSCGCCNNGCLSPTSDEGAEEGEEMAGSNVSSGWALLTIALLLLPIAPLARSWA